jgi:acetylornithine/N-succinyldiaminopimelate aminotransferase
MTATDDLQQRWDAVMMANYGTPPVALASGDGARVTDADGRTYLDLVAGIAVSSLGHAHPAIVAAVSEQVRRIAHTSNLYVNPLAVMLAERLVDICGLPEGRAFLCNDGASANEAAIKVSLRARPGRRRFVAAEGSFHGRSLGALALTGKAAAREPFAPYGIDVDFVPYDDVAALDAAVGDGTAGVVLEPIQGEAGVVVPTPGYLTAARAICDRAGALLVIDEVQGGIGRTGRWLAHQREPLTPDIVTLAKGLGGGLPIGACIAGGDAATALRAGDHGSTFGGNPVCCAAALAVLDTIEADGLLGHVARLGERWRSELAAIDSPVLAGVRGSGLWLALLVGDGAAAQVQVAAREQGFLVNAIGSDIVRLVPPLLLADTEADSFTTALPGVLAAAQAATRLAS